MPLPFLPLTRSRTLAIPVPVAVALVAAALYAGALGNGFAFDDVRIIADNTALHSLRTLPAALLEPYWRGTGEVYRPLPVLGYALDWAVSGGAPWFLHGMNVLWHAFVAFLVTRLAQRGLDEKGAALAGLTFAAHPVHVEAVANTVGRAELMSAAALLGVALVVSDRDARRRWRWGTIAALSAAALASKEVGIAAPAIAWAGALTASRSNREAGRAAAAAVLGLAPVLVLRYLVLGEIGGIRPHVAFAAGTVTQDIALALSSFPQVLGLLFLPMPPRPDYSPPLAVVLAPDPLLLAAGALVVVAAAAVIFRHAAAPTFFTFALVVGVAAYAPVSNLGIQTGVVIAERTLYAASAGAAIVIAAAIGSLPRPAAGALAALWLALGAWRTTVTVPSWRSDEALFAFMRDRAPASYVTYRYAAFERRGAGDDAGARRDIRHALALFDRDPRLLTEAAADALREGARGRAIALLERATAIDPNDLYSRALLIELSMRDGQRERARHLAAEGLRRHPDQRRWRSVADSVQ